MVKNYKDLVNISGEFAKHHVGTKKSFLYDICYTKLCEFNITIYNINIQIQYFYSNKIIINNNTFMNIFNNLFYISVGLTFNFLQCIQPKGLPPSIEHVNWPRN